MSKKAVFIVLAFFISGVSASTADFKNDFGFVFAEIVYLITNESWDDLSAYESENTKCGFGPDQHGLGCIEKLLSANPACKADVLFALNQGCRIYQEKENQVSCVSPPQYQDSEVLMPNNSRISFIYEKPTSKILIDVFICGGD